MKMTPNKLYDLVLYSLKERPEDWTYTDHYHKYRKGIGIPYTIENNEIGVSIWMANGVPFCNIKLKRDIKINFYKKFKLYRAGIKMVLNNSNYDNGLEVPLSKKYSRDMKLNDLLND